MSLTTQRILMPSKNELLEVFVPKLRNCINSFEENIKRLTLNNMAPPSPNVTILLIWSSDNRLFGRSIDLLIAFFQCH